MIVFRDGLRDALRSIKYCRMPHGDGQDSSRTQGKNNHIEKETGASCQFFEIDTKGLGISEDPHEGEQALHRFLVHAKDATGGIGQVQLIPRHKGGRDEGKSDMLKDWYWIERECNTAEEGETQ